MGQFKSMKVYGALAAIVLIGGGLYLWKAEESAHQPVSGAVQGAFAKLKSAPGFELPDSANKIHRLEDFKGKAVVIHFWASWCPPCLEELPRWLQMAEDFKDKPVQLVAISLDDNWEDALRILPAGNLPAGVISLLDSKSQISDAYGTFQFPETYLLSTDQRIVTKWVGGQDWKDPKVVELINQAQQQPAVAR